MTRRSDVEMRTLPPTCAGLGIGSSVRVMEEMVTTTQIVDEYGVSRRTIKRRIEDGSLTPTMKIPGKSGAYLYDRAEVARLFARDSAA